MGEKKSMKVSLRTVICLCIILIFALVIVYYFGFIAKKETNNTVSLNTENTNNIESNTLNVNPNNNISSNASNDNIKKNGKLKIEPSYYVLKTDEIDENSFGEETWYYTETDMGFSISFSNGNKFNAYLGDGLCIKGIYSISGNMVNCVATTFYGEYSPEQETNANISFNINSENEIEVIDASEYYTIKMTNLKDLGEEKTEWVLTNESKQLSLAPFSKGIKYISNK